MSRYERTIENKEFTREMRQTHTILVPQMCPIHFGLLESILVQSGYNVVLLTNNGPSVVGEGLKYVHNDTCYPALLVIGQMLDALGSGKYDLDHTALLITQTGGGCRASNYIFLLRKALKKAGYGQIPVVSLNFSGLEKNSGFRASNYIHLLRKALVRAGFGQVPVISLNMSGLEKNSGFQLSLGDIWKMLGAVIYGDALMILSNQIRPYEEDKGEADELVRRWSARLTGQFEKGKGCTPGDMKRNLDNIARDFAAIPFRRTPKVKTGVVGEIYVKYASLGNNNLEAFLASQDCEVMVPGLMGFLMYCVDNGMQDHKLYGGQRKKYLLNKLAMSYLRAVEGWMIDAIARYPNLVAPTPFYESKKLAEGIIGFGCKMGEGWLLTAEMVELVHSGYANIICTQPFGCLPNHICGKGMIHRLRELYGDTSNIVAIDYDPSATRVNQENRIKLMLSVAREELARTESGPQPAREKAAV